MTAELFNSAESVATYAATAVEISVFLRLAWLGLLSELKIFAFFLVFDAARTLALLAWDYHSPSYQYVWSISSPITTFLVFAVVLELSRGVREPIIEEKVNRLCMLFGFLIGLTVSAAACIVLHPQLIDKPMVLLTVFGNRCVLSGCILGLLAQGAYLFIGSAPLLANMRLHRRVLLVFMTAAVVASFTSGSEHQGLVEWTQLLRNFSHLGCFCAWGLGLRRVFSDRSEFSPSDFWHLDRIPTDAQFADIIVYNRRQRQAQTASPTHKTSAI